MQTLMFRSILPATEEVKTLNTWSRKWHFLFSDATDELSVFQDKAAPLVKVAVESNPVNTHPWNACTPIVLLYSSLFAIICLNIWKLCHYFYPKKCPWSWQEYFERFFKKSSQWERCNVATVSNLYFYKQSRPLYTLICWASPTDESCPLSDPQRIKRNKELVFTSKDFQG